MAPSLQIFKYNDTSYNNKYKISYYYPTSPADYTDHVIHINIVYWCTLKESTITTEHPSFFIRFKIANFPIESLPDEIPEILWISHIVGSLDHYTSLSAKHQIG